MSAHPSASVPRKRKPEEQVVPDFSNKDAYYPSNKSNDGEVVGLSHSNSMGAFNTSGTAQLSGSLERDLPVSSQDYPVPNFDYVYSKMRDPETGFQLADRRWRLVSYSNTFVGSEAVRWIIDNLGLTRENAIQFGQRLADAGIIHHVTNSEPFLDEYFFYRFQEDEESNVLNMKRIWENGIKPRHPCDVAQSLLTRLACLCEEYRKKIVAAAVANQSTALPNTCSSSASSPSLLTYFISGGGNTASAEDVDYQMLAQSDDFRQYAIATAELQRVDLSTLDHFERVAFFVNIYNTLCLHSHVQYGPPKNFVKRWIFFRSYSYRIAGLDFTLDDIEHGILRGNKRPPSLRFMQQFRSSDPKVQHILQNRDGRIHFVISAGTRSDPPMRILDADNVEEELHDATEDFLNHTVKVDSVKRHINLPKIFKWYSDDFPRPDRELLKWIGQYLRSNLQLKFLNLLDEVGENDLPTISYENFDWSSPEARFDAAVVRRKRRKLERLRGLDTPLVSPMLYGPGPGFAAQIHHPSPIPNGICNIVSNGSKQHLLNEYTKVSTALPNPDTINESSIVKNNNNTPNRTNLSGNPDLSTILDNARKLYEPDFLTPKQGYFQANPPPDDNTPPKTLGQNIASSDVEQQQERETG